LLNILFYFYFLFFILYLLFFIINKTANIGAVLDELGFGKMMDMLMDKYITPFAKFLFLDCGGATLNERHAFVVWERERERERESE
jgi:hypothetical protein